MISMAAGVALGGVSTGAAAQPKAGGDYKLVKPQVPTESGDKIEVVEFFLYSCPHCNAFEPFIRDWKKKLPPDVAFRKVHVAFRERRHQSMFYALEALGKAEELNDRIFSAIHVDKNPLDSTDKMTAFLQPLGIDPKQFLEAYESFAVRTKGRQASQLGEAYGIDGVPTVGVNGKYLTAPSMVGMLGSNAGAIKVIDHLIDLERKAKK